MRTLDDEADALRAVREHVAKAWAASPEFPKTQSTIADAWDEIAISLDLTISRIDRALKEIGATMLVRFSPKAPKETRC